MAYSVETTTRTPVTQLREALDKAERLVVQIDGNSVAQFLALLDSIEQQFEILDATDSDIRSEQSRWEGLLRRVDRQPEPIVRAANVAGGMEKLRAAHPPAESFWWQLDKEVTRRRVRAIRSLITTIVTVVVVAVGGYWAINYFFPPNPEAVMMVETNSGIDNLITEQRWQEALDMVQAARAQFPANAELAVWEVVLYERMENAEAAATSLAEAEQLLATDPMQVLLYLGNNRLRVGDFEGALAVSDQALQLDPNNPQVHFLLGGIAEAQGDLGVAIAYFEQTFQLAESSNPQLAVIARVRMGNLMQNPGSFGASEATPSPAP